MDDFLGEQFRFGDYLEVPITGDKVLDSDEALAAKVIKVVGAITAPASVVLPHRAGGDWVFINDTTGGYAVTFKGPTGSGVSVDSGATALGVSDGTNYVSPAAKRYVTGRFQSTVSVVAGVADIEITPVGYSSGFSFASGKLNVEQAGKYSVRMSGWLQGSMTYSTYTLVARVNDSASDLQTVAFIAYAGPIPFADETVLDLDAGDELDVEITGSDDNLDIRCNLSLQRLD